MCVFHLTSKWDFFLSDFEVHGAGYWHATVNLTINSLVLLYLTIFPLLARAAENNVKIFIIVPSQVILDCLSLALNCWAFINIILYFSELHKGWHHDTFNNPELLNLYLTLKKKITVAMDHTARCIWARIFLSMLVNNLKKTLPVNFQQALDIFIRAGCTHCWITKEVWEPITQCSPAELDQVVSFKFQLTSNKKVTFA